MHRMVANFSEEMQCSFSMDSIISECVVNATASNFCSIRVKNDRLFLCVSANRIKQTSRFANSIVSVADCPALQHIA